MLGTCSDVIAFIMKDDNYPLFLPIHCVIHHEHLAAKYSKYDKYEQSTMTMSWYFAAKCYVCLCLFAATCYATYCSSYNTS